MTSDKIDKRFNGAVSSVTNNPAQKAEAFEAEHGLTIDEINYIGLEHEYGSKEMIYDFTQKVNQLEKASLHPKYKVGSIILGKTISGRVFAIPAVNQVPKPIDGIFPIEDTKAFANSSASAHAEMEALTHILDLDEEIESMYLFSSKTCCPSCAKMLSLFDNADDKHPKMKGLFTDGKTLSGSYTDGDEEQIEPKDFWDLALGMLKPILGRGKLPLYLVGKKNGKIKLTEKVGKKSSTTVKTENNLKITEKKKQSLDKINYKTQIEKAEKLAVLSKLEHKNAGIAYGEGPNGRIYKIKATDSLSSGLIYDKDAVKMGDIEHEVREVKGKKTYSLRVSPLENILSNALRHRIVITKLFSTEIPPSGIMLNAVSAGLEEIITKPMMLDLKNEDHLAFADLILSGAIKCDTARVPKNYTPEFLNKQKKTGVELNKS